MTLPFTKKEWPWEENDMKDVVDVIDHKQKPKEEDYDSSRLAHASTYIMNALFVLMTTNYTLNPNNYYMSFTGDEDKISSFLLYFPLVQIMIGSIYFGLKIYTSD